MHFASWSFIFTLSILMVWEGAVVRTQTVVMDNEVDYLWEVIDLFSLKDNRNMLEASFVAPYGAHRIICNDAFAK